MNQLNKDPLLVNSNRYIIDWRWAAVTTKKGVSELAPDFIWHLNRFFPFPCTVINTSFPQEGNLTLFHTHTRINKHIIFNTITNITNNTITNIIITIITITIIAITIITITIIAITIITITIITAAIIIMTINDIIGEVTTVKSVL